jgi:hypothetical protein
MTNSLLTNAYAKIRDNAISFSAFAAGVAVTQGVNFLGYGGMYQSNSEQHAVTGAKAAEQSSLITEGLATGNMTLISMANAMAVKMEEHCEASQNHDYSTAVALYVIGALVLAGGALAAYKVSQNAPQPGYTAINNSPS